MSIFNKPIVGLALCLMTSFIKTYGQESPGSSLGRQFYEGGNDAFWGKLNNNFFRLSSGLSDQIQGALYLYKSANMQERVSRISALMGAEIGAKAGEELAGQRGEMIGKNIGATVLFAAAKKCARQNDYEGIRPDAKRQVETFFTAAKAGACSQAIGYVIGSVLGEVLPEPLTKTVDNWPSFSGSYFLTNLFNLFQDMSIHITFRPLANRVPAESIRDNRFAKEIADLSIDPFSLGRGFINGFRASRRQRTPSDEVSIEA